MIDVSPEKKQYDFTVVGAVAAGSVLAAELSASVMPRIITGPGTAASTHTIAGRAAQLILG